ncbi:hypothetical protein [Aquimarina litoralis]|uniref:hypothetical protein n=1 Tax=Aquimarina litoralis TaxID=584605 RepID=UPI001C5904B5|nr:hypothetical protein [Aquimarina litoralis]MBW1295683.1 hypothetical protein [Aquimarina litoralis]
MSTIADNQNSEASIPILEAFIPLFFEDNTLNIENILTFHITLQKNWKTSNLSTKDVSKVIDHPPEIYLS